MKLVLAILKPSKLDEVVDALQLLDELGGITVSDVRGFGRQRGRGGIGEVAAYGSLNFVPKVRIETVVPDALVDTVLQTIHRHAHTGTVGDGKVFVLDMEDAMRVRTGERGEAALGKKAPA